MFDKFFAFIRRGVTQAVLDGFTDAADQLAVRIEEREQKAIEATTQPVEAATQTNGRKRKTAAT